MTWKTSWRFATLNHPQRWLEVAMVHHANLGNHTEAHVCLITKNAIKIIAIPCVRTMVMGQIVLIAQLVATQHIAAINVM
jgi:hypothetical protein